MPLVRVDHPHGKSAEYRKAIGDVVYEALLTIMKAPQDDRFQIFSEHPPEGLFIHPEFQGIKRSREALIIQVTLNEGRTTDQKQAFYRFIADGLHKRIGLRHEDVVINLVEVAKDNWFYGMSGA